MASVQSILFVTSQLRPREIKIAHALKSIGWQVDLIYFPSTPFQPEGIFDSIVKIKNPREAHTYAKKIKPKLIHVFSGAIDDFILLFCQEKIAPVVIDLNDIFSASLMDYCPERFPLTKEALGLADGFCARDLQIKCAEKFDECKIPNEVIFFPEYCWNNTNFSSYKTSDNNEIHIVSVGTISLETYGMYDCCYIALTKKIIGEKIHLHIYPPWCYRKDYMMDTNANFEKDYAEFIEIAKNNQYLHIHDSLPLAVLAEELPRYDFGIISGGCKEFGQYFSHFKPAYVESCYSGRISDYLDAGLPVLINEEVTFNYKLLKRYQVGIDLKEILYPDFKEKLLKLKQNSLLKQKVANARQQLSIQTNAKRLETFYNEIIHSNRTQFNKHALLKNWMQQIPQKIKQILQI